jgi:outer membrane protein OmpA-like peptidoglycan-associated protein
MLMNLLLRRVFPIAFGCFGLSISCTSTTEDVSIDDPVDFYSGSSMDESSLGEGSEDFSVSGELTEEPTMDDRSQYSASNDDTLELDLFSDSMGSAGSSDLSAGLETPSEMNEMTEGPSAASSSSYANFSNTAVRFPFNSAKLSKANKKKLEKIVSDLKQDPSLNLQISGHADTRGTAKHNMKLSARRAQAIKQFLVSRGVASSQLKTLHFGATRPLVQGKSKQAHRQNRRGELKMDYSDNQVSR